MLLTALFAFMLAVHPAQAPSVNSLEFLGKFSNMNYSEDHQYGQDIYLWSHSGKILGYMEYSLGGALGDITVARIEEVKHDPKTGHFAFEARNPLYTESGEVIRNYFVFSGFLNSSSLHGYLGCRPASMPDSCAPTLAVIWQRVRDTASGAVNLSSIEELESFIQDRLASQGARW